MFVGSFAGDFEAFQSDTVAAINSFKASGVEQLLIDLTNNGGMLSSSKSAPNLLFCNTGGFVCLGQFLHQYLAGSNFGYP
jgi:hypothetical protein